MDAPAEPRLPKPVLGAPLPFVTRALSDDFDGGALQAFRLNYASFRFGSASGAKGESPFHEKRGTEGALYAELALTHKALLGAEREVFALREAALDLEAMRAAYQTKDEDLAPSQRNSRGALRDEFARRHTQRTARVAAAAAELGSRVGKGSIGCTAYQFTTGEPVVTKVLVARGIVSAPENAGFEIIPASSASSPIIVMTDETVNGLYGDRFVLGLERLGYHVMKIVIPDGEDAKTLQVYARLTDEILSMGIDKSSVLVSLGGGAVANVCGFIASTLHRGVGLVHFPTTLLAQCDAAISHKQAVNAPHGKNLVGSYYAPIAIVVDPDVLQSLQDWLLPDGMGEIVKHALCQDADLLRVLDEYDGPLTDPDFLEDVVRRTIKLKCDVIDIDPQEKREAVVLIYGHTLGHPVEAISHRPGSLCCLSHGQAVAIGCVIAARVAVDMGLCDASAVQRTIDLCVKYSLPWQVPPDQSVHAIMAKLPYNKTWTKEGTRMALLQSVGRLFNVDAHYHLPVSDDVIFRAVEASMAPRGTIILGAGSSGFLRRNKFSKSDIIAAADNQVPGSGWTAENGLHAC
ncbi:hypothetical protein M885DRAFT_9818 [Pelagophyceae sp. CCMP2097]|nr:hypothetical protein M885DRAFT_9818 [Pelagophyceae sp. CCMP2097]|mmetsp:Transcript_21024/g.74766  ORF Transcript_21024/g.74766 Transcript_21024/m.74766 type:complete len:575 (+) Transcript_21024:166-1890(+)